jgi:hypothetical protein
MTVTVAGGEVTLGVIAKIAVCVKSGVGNENGVGEARLGKVHEAASIARRIKPSIRPRIAMSASIEAHVNEAHVKIAWIVQ